MSELRVELVLSEEQVDLVAALVADLLAERFAPSPAGPTSDWLTVEEAAAYVGASRQRIYDLRSSGRLGRYGDGRRGLVSRRELDELVAAGTARPAHALPPGSATGFRSGIQT